VILTHDVESTCGIERVQKLATLEKNMGFRSCFNFVGDDYVVPSALLNALVTNGFEIGVHGFHHNGFMFSNKRTFHRHALGIRRRMKEWNARGFRSPSMHRKLEWIHDLDVAYDSSTFDTDPFEPQPDGIGTIFPLWIVDRERRRAFVELPYTLPQDFTLFAIMQERGIDIWKRKLDWVAKHGGMALMIVHPDYMAFDGDKRTAEQYPSCYYSAFLNYLQEQYKNQYWAALPSEVAKYFSSIYPKPVSRYRKRLRVCMPTYSFYESDNRVRRYAEALANNGSEVDVVSLRRVGQSSRDDLNGVHVYRIQERVKNERCAFGYLWRTTKFLAKSLFTISRLELRQHYDLVHVHNIPDTQVFSALLPKLRGAKIILDIHDVVPELFCSKFQKDPASFLYRLLLWMERLSTRFANHVITANDLWGEKLVHRSIGRDKCTTLLNYPEPAIFSRQPFQHDSKREFILYPGTLNLHQGLDIALKAFSRVKDRLPNLDFLIYGEGQELDELKRLASHLRIDDRVMFRGLVPAKQIAQVMASAKCGIVPKRADLFGNEAFSTKVFEFMSLGVPVILSDTKIDRYYFNPSLVLFFDSGNDESLAEKMLMLLTDEDLRKKLVKNSLDFVKDYSWTNKQQSYFDIIESLAKKQPRLEQN